VTFLEDRRLFLFNGTDGFYTVSSVCTHLGCNVKRPPPGSSALATGAASTTAGGRARPGAGAARLVRPQPFSRGELIVDLDRAVGPDFRLKA